MSLYSVCPLDVTQSIGVMAHNLTLPWLSVCFRREGSCFTVSKWRRHMFAKSTDGKIRALWIFSLVATPSDIQHNSPIIACNNLNFFYRSYGNIFLVFKLKFQNERLIQYVSTNKIKINLIFRSLSSEYFYYFI